MAEAAALTCQLLAWMLNGKGRSSNEMEKPRRTESIVINTLIPETHMNIFTYFYNVKTC